MNIRPKTSQFKLIVTPRVTVPVSTASDPGSYTPSVYGMGPYSANIYSQGAGKPYPGSGWVLSQLCPDPAWAQSVLPSFVTPPVAIPAFMRFKQAA